MNLQASDHEVLIQRFKNHTSESYAESRFYLEEHQWDLGRAMIEWSGAEIWAKDKQLPLQPPHVAPIAIVMPVAIGPTQLQHQEHRAVFTASSVANPTTTGPTPAATGRERVVQPRQVLELPAGVKIVAPTDVTYPPPPPSPASSSSWLFELPTVPTGALFAAAGRAKERILQLQSNNTTPTGAGATTSGSAKKNSFGYSRGELEADDACVSLLAE